MWSELEEEVTNYVINSLAPDKEQFAHAKENVNGECVLLDIESFIIRREFISMTKYCYSDRSDQAL